jgi:hypothetical protein
MRARCSRLLTIACTSLLSTAPTRAQDTSITLSSGTFEQLMLVADRESKILSGYYRATRGSGECRLALRGPLVRASLGQRSSVGEGYSVEVWDPRRSHARLTAEIFSLTREGFTQQLILSIRDGLSTACRAADTFDHGWGASLNRYNWVSNSFIGVRVVRSKRARLYDLVKVDGVLRRVRIRVRAPRRHDGVWVEKTHSPEYSPRGMVRIAWYEVGAPRAAYVHEWELYPEHLPAPVDDR